MILEEAKIGDRVVVYCQRTAGSLIMLANKTSISDEIEAEVLFQDPTKGTTLGWRAGEEHPTHSIYNATFLEPSWQAQGFDIVQAYGSHCKCELAKTKIAVSKPIAAGPVKKIYVNECPCGLHPSQCDYHRP